MNKIKLLIATAFFASITLLTGCGQQADETPATGDSSETPEAVDSPDEESGDMSEEVKLIPVAVWSIIDVNQAGKVTSEEFVKYYLVKAEEGDKLDNEEEAQEKFQSLDKDGDGQLTKKEATGEE